MKISLFLIMALTMVSCGKEQHDVTVKTNIKGLKKGTVYLKKIQDTALVSVDSIVVNGNPEFELHTDLESPEVLYLYLDKQSSENDHIPFFADRGVTDITTTLKNFVFDAKIKGSDQQKVWEEYKLMMSRFNESNLNLIKENLEAQKIGDSSKLENIENKYNNLLKRKYLYTVNFALNHKDSEVAPYLALSEIYNAQVKYLDTIYSELTPKVKMSKYGKELQSFINSIKSKEQA